MCLRGSQTVCAAVSFRQQKLHITKQLSRSNMSTCIRLIEPSKIYYQVKFQVIGDILSRLKAKVTCHQHLGAL